MKVNETNYRTIWMEGNSVFMIDQNKLPFHFAVYESKTSFDTCFAITTMVIRGAGAIGAAGGFAMAQAFLEAPVSGTDDYIENARFDIESSRPTARNLFYAVNRVYKAGKVSVEKAVEEALRIADEDAHDSQSIGYYGNQLIRDGFRIETHCNAGWLAFVDYGTALSPIYTAFREGKEIFVYVDETRPRGQGARLTAWELNNEGVPHTIIPDNAGAWLMSKGMVDMIIVGADRIAANGDVANKIGTLEKAIAAREYGIPFYVAAPSSTFDIDCSSGDKIPIEERSGEEVLFQTGIDKNGNLNRVLVCSPGSSALNYAFDVTPAKYISGFITEKGILPPDPLIIRVTLRK